VAQFHNQNLTILYVKGCDIPPGPYSSVAYKDSNGKPAERIDINNVSPDLLTYLREQDFDLVVIPHEKGSFWRGTNLEQFASVFANCIVNVFAHGDSRTYRGEDIHRIQYNKAYLNSMFRYIPSIHGKRVLEVGCADGLSCDLLLSEEPKQITGVDVLAIVGCGYRNQRIQYQQVDGSSLPFADDSFDVVYSIATLEHCFDPFKVMEEMKRVTSPGGYCYIQAGPLYFSPFGHHMFGYFDDLPWAHLRLSPDEMIERLTVHGMDRKIDADLGEDAKTYVSSMMHINHINGRSIDDYGLDYFEKLPGIDLIASTRSYEGENLLTPQIEMELGHLSRKDLLAHGFELVFKKK
jgi:SAM-dependent methyltransferase